MLEKRTKIQAFQSKPSEHERIVNASNYVGKNRANYMRDLVMKDVAKQERKMKG